MANKHLVRCVNCTAVVLIAFGLVSAGTSPAAAQGETTKDVKFEMQISPPGALSKPLCVGQSVTLFVIVQRIISWVEGGRGYSELDHVTSTGYLTDFTLADPQVLDFVDYLPDAEVPPLALEGLVFKADKPGRTTIQFVHEISPFWLGVGRAAATDATEPILAEKTVTATVVKCKAKVKGVHRWSGSDFLLAGTMDEAEMEADEQGNFTGTGTITWLSQVALPPDCEAGSFHSDEFSPSQVDLTGQMDEDGRLTVQLTYQPAQDSVTFHCIRLGGLMNEEWSATVFETPEALSLDVPAEGGASARSQVLVGEQASVSGDAVLIVIPEEDEAVSALPNLQAARLGLDGGIFWRLFAGLARWAAAP